MAVLPGPGCSGCLSWARLQWLSYLGQAAVAVLPEPGCNGCFTWARLQWLSYLSQVAMAVLPGPGCSGCLTWAKLQWLSYLGQAAVAVLPGPGCSGCLTWASGCNKLALQPSSAMSHLVLYPSAPTPTPPIHPNPVTGMVTATSLLVLYPPLPTPTLSLAWSQRNLSKPQRETDGEGLNCQ